MRSYVVTLVAMQAQHQDAAGAPSAGQDATQAAPGRGGQRGGGRGRGDAPTVGPGNLMTGAWGAERDCR